MAETRRLKALRRLSSSMAAADPAIERGLRSARDVGLQQAVAATPTTRPRTAQALGAQQAARAGEQQLATAQRSQQQQRTVAGLATDELAGTERERLAGQQRGVRQLRERTTEELSRLGEDIRNDIHDSRLEFRKDERGRTYWNERQLADWTTQKVRNREEFANWAQRSQQMHRRKLQLLRAAHAKIEQTLRQGFVREQGDLDRRSKERLVRMKREMEQRAARAAAEAANKQAMWSAAGTLLGVGAGAVIGGPAGAAAGGSVGGALGGLGGSTIG